jgi:Zinc-finger domain of monoamine-oxidase A repressor R1
VDSFPLRRRLGFQPFSRTTAAMFGVFAPVPDALGGEGVAMDAQLEQLLMQCPVPETESSLFVPPPPAVSSYAILPSMLGDYSVISGGDQLSAYSCVDAAVAVGEEYRSDESPLCSVDDVNNYLLFDIDGDEAIPPNPGGAGGAGGAAHAVDLLTSHNKAFSNNNKGACKHAGCGVGGGGTACGVTSPSSPTSLVTSDDVMMDMPLVAKSGRRDTRARNSSRNRQVDVSPAKGAAGKTKRTARKGGKGRGPGRIPKQAAPGEEDATVADAVLLLLKPKKSRKKAKFDSPVASRFCHVCSRTPKNVRLAVCCKITDGVCRKVICEKCFVEFGYGSFEGALHEKNWLCPHCAGVCPERAQCRTYSRINDKLRVSRLKQPKQPRKTPTKKGASPAIPPGAAPSSAAPLSNYPLPASHASLPAGSGFEGLTTASSSSSAAAATGVSLFHFDGLVAPPLSAAGGLCAVGAGAAALELAGDTSPPGATAPEPPCLAVVPAAAAGQEAELGLPITSFDMCVHAHAEVVDELSTTLFPPLMDSLQVLSGEKDPMHW